MSKLVLFVLTSHPRKGDTGDPTGAYLPEIVHPYNVLDAAGVAIDFVSPGGGMPPLDGVDETDAESMAFLRNPLAMARLERSLTPDMVDPSRYDAVFYAGGHGTMWDLPEHAELAAITAQIYERGAPVAAVCHGPAGLVNVRLADGSYLVAGKEVAAFTNAEEDAVELSDVVPFLLADKLTERGAVHRSAANWEEQVVVSGHLITGQNPASARKVGEALRRAVLGNTEAP